MFSLSYFIYERCIWNQEEDKKNKNNNNNNGKKKGVHGRSWKILLELSDKLRTFIIIAEGILGILKVLKIFYK